MQCDNLSVWKVPPSGDCFYAAVQRALSSRKQDTQQESVSQEDRKGVHFLRGIVAEAVTEELLDTYRIYYESKVRGYSFMRHVETLQDLQQIIRISGQNGVTKCVWADAFAVQTLSTQLGLVFLIVNEQRRSTHTIIKPQHGEEKEWMIVILELTRRDHYNLVYWNDKAAFLPHELPPLASQVEQHLLQTEQPQSKKVKQ